MINIYYSTDDKLFGQQVLSLISLIRNTDEELNIVNLTLEVKEYNKHSTMTSKEQDEFCDKLVKSKNPNSRFVSIDVSDLFREHLLKGPNVHNKYYSYFVVTRLLADLVPEIQGKFLYLDSDVMFNDDVKKLWDIDVENYEFAGRRDSFRITNYLQSGVMLFNMDNMRASNAMKIARELCCTKKYICYIDMGALNTACKRKKRISKIYNTYTYRDDCVAFHVCGVREGAIPFSKKWRHRIKPDEFDLFVKKVPQMKEYVDEYVKYMIENPDLFKKAYKPSNWDEYVENYKKETTTNE